MNSTEIQAEYGDVSLTDEQVNHAVITVCEHAFDAEDARLILTKLDLL